MKKNLSYISQKLGVSTVTVSNALNDRSGVSDELRKKIKNMALELGISQEQLKVKANRVTDNIAVFMSERLIDKQNISPPFYLDLFQELSNKFLEMGFCAVLITISRQDEDQGNISRLAREGKFVGAVVLGAMRETFLNKLEGIELPTIYVDFYNTDYPKSCILTDNISGSYAITSYLIQKGFRKLAFVGNPHSTTSVSDRYIGFYKACFENGIAVPSEYIVPDRDASGIFFDIRLPEDMPEVFVCCSDRTAYNLYKAIAATNYKVGVDVSVTGFDDDMFARICNPELTTVAIDLSIMALRSVETLTSIIKNKEQTASNLRISCSPVYRKSVVEKG